MSAPDRRRIRATDKPVMEVPLAPEIALAVRIAADAAGIGPEQLIADILRDVFEPVFSGRGKLAVESANAKGKPGGTSEGVPI